MTTRALTALSMAVVGLMMVAPQAAASPEDDLCRSITSVGYTGDCTTLTTLARDACAQFARGADSTEVAEKLDIATKDETLSNFIVAGARLYLCPEPQQA
ncbi:DUF732 domain-containing protein [Mycolicibacterium celeriflavum]|uniref:DUF732 domain-containing protein n=1 Tax=Mycolicibacterium celeriflavum TaxID=1249101 RepID=UPI003CFB93C5